MPKRLKFVVEQWLLFMVRRQTWQARLFEIFESARHFRIRIGTSDSNRMSKLRRSLDWSYLKVVTCTYNDFDYRASLDWYPNFSTKVTYYASAPVWGNKRCVCPSVAYIANNLKTQRPIVPKFGRKFPHLRCDSQTSFNIKRSKVRVTRPINGDRHRAPYLPNGKAYTNFKLGIYRWRRTTTLIGHRCHDLQGQRSKSYAHIVCTSHASS